MKKALFPLKDSSIPIFLPLQFFLEISSDGIFSSFDVGIDTIGGDAPILSAYTAPSINEKGKVAFNAGLDVGGQGVFVGDGRKTIEIANSSSEFDLFSAADINDKDTVAFLAQRDNGTRGIFTSSNGKVDLFVDDSGPFRFFNSDPALNNKGEIAFFAELDNGEAGIFVGNDPVADRVISVGEDLFGSRVVELGIVQEGFNDRGQIGFQARFENGNLGVFRADPVCQVSDDTLLLGSDSQLAGTTSVDELLNGNNQGVGQFQITWAEGFDVNHPGVDFDEQLKRMNLTDSGIGSSELTIDTDDSENLVTFAGVESNCFI